MGDSNGHPAAADDEAASGSFMDDRAYLTGQAAAVRPWLTKDFGNG
jgi:hypothetical protein